MTPKSRNNDSANSGSKSLSDRILYIISSVLHSVKIPVVSSKIYLIARCIHSLSNPPASFTFSFAKSIFTSLCIFTLLIADKLVISTLSFSIFIQSAPISHGIRYFSNRNRNHASFYWNGLFEIASADEPITTDEKFVCWGRRSHLNSVFSSLAGTYIALTHYFFKDEVTLRPDDKVLRGLNRALHFGFIKLSRFTG
jgi:hypothetical protein